MKQFIFLVLAVSAFSSTFRRRSGFALAEPMFPRQAVDGQGIGIINSGMMRSKLFGSVTVCL